MRRSELKDLLNESISICLAGKAMKRNNDRGKGPQKNEQMIVRANRARDGLPAHGKDVVGARLSHGFWRHFECVVAKRRIGWIGVECLVSRPEYFVPQCTAAQSRDDAVRIETQFTHADWLQGVQQQQRPDARIDCLGQHRACPDNRAHGGQQVATR